MTLQDTLTKAALSIASTYRYIVGVTAPGPFVVPADYSLAFQDFFYKDYKKNWIPTQGWEQPYHPGNVMQWYDANQIKIVKEGVALNAVYKPAFFNGVEVYNAIGLLKSKSAWQYGIFKVSAMLPYGNYLWPAIWLSGSLTWPPEIDIMEGYSKSTLDYFQYKRLQSNVHFKEKDLPDDHIGATNHPLPNNASREFIDYTLWWEKDFIKIYYNKYLVLHIRDKKVLDLMNEKQNLILNNGVQEGFNTCISPMVISSVQIFQK